MKLLDETGFSLTGRNHSVFTIQDTLIGNNLSYLSRVGVCDEYYSAMEQSGCL